MIYIPGGTFTMGHPDVENAQPVTITVEPYFIDRTEVTVAAFAECVEHGPCRGYVIPPHPHPELFTDQKERRFLEAQCTWGKPGLDNHPINCVTWDQARQYCEFRRVRLPTEAQWEFAARGTDGRLYPWGNEDVTDSTRGNFADQAQLRLMTEAGVPPGSPYPFDDGYGATAPVASYSAGASAFGAEPSPHTIPSAARMA